MVQFVIFIRRRSFLKKFIGCNFDRDRFEKRVNEGSFFFKLFSLASVVKYSRV